MHQSFFKRILLYEFILGFLIQATVVKAEPPAEKTVQLNLCSDQKLGFKMKCNPDWKLQAQNDNMFIILSESPNEVVTATISKSKNEVKNISELTRSVLQEIGQYENFFTITKTTVGTQPALKVEAKSKEFPEIQLYDFYVVRNNHLYSILFSCKPESRFTAYKPLFIKIIESFEFI